MVQVLARWIFSQGRIWGTSSCGWHIGSSQTSIAGWYIRWQICLNYMLYCVAQSSYTCKVIWWADLCWNWNISLNLKKSTPIFSHPSYQILALPCIDHIIFTFLNKILSCLLRTQRFLSALINHRISFFSCISDIGETLLDSDMTELSSVWVSLEIDLFDQFDELCVLYLMVAVLPLLISG